VTEAEELTAACAQEHAEKCAQVRTSAPRPLEEWWVVFHSGLDRVNYAFRRYKDAEQCLARSVGGALVLCNPAAAANDLRREIEVLKESRAAAVRQEQVSRNEANRLRWILMDLDDRLTEEHAP